jgi:hypothetical protein
MKGQIICNHCDCYDYCASWLQGCWCICHIPQELETESESIWARN